MLSKSQETYEVLFLVDKNGIEILSVEKPKRQPIFTNFKWDNYGTGQMNLSELCKFVLMRLSDISWLSLVAENSLYTICNGLSGITMIKYKKNINFMHVYQ